MSNLDTYNEVVKQFNEKQEELRKLFENALKELVTSFLNKHEHVIAITWIAFRPYFNDGDECIFNIAEIILILNEEVSEEDYEHYCDLELNNKYYKGYDEFRLKEWNEEKRTYVVKEEYKDISEDFDKLQTFIYSNKELVKFLFGEHHKVIISRDNIQVEEYTDHD